MTPRSPRAAAASALAMAAALVLGLAGSGCGSSAVTLDPVAQAADATSHAGGAHMTLSVAIDGGALGGQFTVKAAGTYNMSRQEGELTFDLGGLPATARSQLGSGRPTFTEIFSGGAIYMSSPLFEGKLPGAARWMKLDLAKLQTGLGLDAQALSSGQADPGQFLQYLRAGGGSIKAVGRGAVRGTPTTRYAGTIDLAKAAELLPSSDRTKLKSSVQKLLAQTGLSRLPIQAWVDDHRLVRRIAIDMPLNISGQQASVKVDLELFGFGATPTVKAPSGGEVYEVTSSSIAGALGG
jgi:hypothetical protein